MKHAALILGNGYIGRRLQKALNFAICKKKVHRLHDARQMLRLYRPKILINCIGHTGRTNTDDCFLEQDKTLASNTFAPVLLAEACLQNNIKFVHISSGCLYHFDYIKNKPLGECAVPDFLESFYSRTKIYAEQTLNLLARKYNILIARIRVPLDDRPSEKNILTKLLSYEKIIDLPNSVTYMPDFIKALKHLIKIDARGTYNVVNKGGLRYPDLLKIYAKHVPGFRYKVVPFSKLNLVRVNVLLSPRKLERAGYNVRPIGSVLEECVQNYLKY